MFDSRLLEEIRDRFACVESDPYGGRRVYLENAGGSLTLKSVVEATAHWTAIPDNSGRKTPASQKAAQVMQLARDGIMALIGARSGAIALSESTSSNAFRVLGSKEPTVTDANLLLGRLNPDFFLGGEMSIDVEAARKAIEEKLARPLGMDPLAVAEGVIRVVNASMAKGIRFVSVEKGHDPHDFALVCFGGNGPLHAVDLARELRIPRIMVPFAPGVNCAYGLLVADFRYDYATTYLRKLAEIDLAKMNAAYDELEQSARGKMIDDGISRENIVLSRALDMRYLGQGHELEVPFDGGRITRESLAAVQTRFNDLHRKQYGFSSPEEALEIVNMRISCVGLVPKPEIRQQPAGRKSAAPAVKNRRDVYMGGRFIDTVILDCDRLAPGMEIAGPAIIEQKDSTTLLPPGSAGRIDGYRNIIIDVKVEK